MNPERIEAIATNTCEAYAFSIIVLVFGKEVTNLLEGLTFLCKAFPYLHITLLLCEPLWIQPATASDN